MITESQLEKSNKLKEFVRQYFRETSHSDGDGSTGMMIPQPDEQVPMSGATTFTIVTLSVMTLDVKCRIFGVMLNVVPPNVIKTFLFVTDVGN